MIFQTSMIMFHVNLPGCKGLGKTWTADGENKRLDNPKAYPKRVKVKMPSFKKQFFGEDPVMNLGAQTGKPLAQKVGVSKRLLRMGV